jgi:hypothetical protein
VFRDEPESSKRIFISDHYGLWLICNRCIAKAAALIAKKAENSAPQNRAANRDAPAATPPPS